MLYGWQLLKPAILSKLTLLIIGLVAFCAGILINCGIIICRNKTQKRVLALNRELPPRNEQFLLDFEQLQSQFAVSLGFKICNAVYRHICFLLNNKGSYFLVVGGVSELYMLILSHFCTGPRTIACCDGICSHFLSCEVL